MNFQTAMVIVALGAAGGYVGYKTGTLPKKIAVGVALGVGGLALISAEFESLESSIPWVLGGGVAVAALLFFI